MNLSAFTAAGSAWERDLARASCCALQQSHAYGEAAAAQGVQIRRWQAVGPSGAEARVQSLTRRVLGVPVTAVLRGPVWLDEPGEDAALLTALQRCHPHEILLWQPERLSGQTPNVFHHIMTGASTAWLDLTAPEDARRKRLAGKWRNVLNRAERSALRVVEGVSAPALERLIAEENAQRTERYRGLPAAWLKRVCDAAAPAQAPLLLTAMMAGDPVGQMLYILHGMAATYQVGWLNEEGRRLGGHHLLLWWAMRILAQRGVRALDLGGIDTVKSPGIARFKLGTGANPVTLPGSYLRLPRLWPLRAR